MRNAAVDATVGCWIHGVRFFEGATSIDDVEHSRETRSAADSSSSEDWLSESPRSIDAALFLETVVDGLLSRSTTFFDMGTSSKRILGLALAETGAELDESLVV